MILPFLDPCSIKDTSKIYNRATNGSLHDVHLKGLKDLKSRPLSQKNSQNPGALY